uniref:Uncharacterized protein n=2 Tax=Palpitomonas bilix TaxID=652834 RepID=A0A7S3G8G5_9EUKA|mmetsp:Transcript_28109/g.71663  ORF Transcript_28109/g.71663 Transcript_28109/m.71663 type:complete len:258 (+) Transcript_28109:74-847(+)
MGEKSWMNGSSKPHTFSYRIFESGVVPRRVERRSDSAGLRGPVILQEHVGHEHTVVVPSTHVSHPLSTSGLPTELKKRLAWEHNGLVSQFLLVVLALSVTSVYLLQNFDSASVGSSVLFTDGRVTLVYTIQEARERMKMTSSLSDNSIMVSLIGSGLTNRESLLYGGACSCLAAGIKRVRAKFPETMFQYQCLYVVGTPFYDLELAVGPNRTETVATERTDNLSWMCHWISSHLDFHSPVVVSSQEEREVFIEDAKV